MEFKEIGSKRENTISCFRFWPVLSGRERENLTLSDREQVEDGCLGETKKRYPEYFIPNPTNSDIEKIEKCAFDGPAGFPGNAHFHERNFVDQSGSFLDMFN